MSNILGSGATDAMTPLYDEVLVSVIKSQATLVPSIAGKNADQTNRLWLNK